MELLELELATIAEPLEYELLRIPNQGGRRVSSSLAGGRIIREPFARASSSSFYRRPRPLLPIVLAGRAATWRQEEGRVHDKEGRPWTRSMAESHFPGQEKPPSIKDDKATLQSAPW